MTNEELLFACLNEDETFRLTVRNVPHKRTYNTEIEVSWLKEAGLIRTMHREVPCGLSEISEAMSGLLEDALKQMQLRGW